MLQRVDQASEGYIPVTSGLVWYKIVNPGNDTIPLLTLHGGPGSPHDYLEPLERLADSSTTNLAVGNPNDQTT